ncbi:tubby-like protein [Artemisia annua]|uniref:Tubby-like protein n=1 Tax=Artemisia annua TaxID=35608 RepID=A0A2U1NML2_ARTAN|nr:tubby-like protein [Artemisia annua]
MSFKSILQDMKGEFGSISRKGFGSRSRSLRVVEDRSDVVVDAFKQSCWANMPPELLRDVLMRIEESEGVWPVRKNVVSCAGVCRNWREVMKEIVKIPEVSGKLTFPISLKQMYSYNGVTFRRCFSIIQWTAEGQRLWQSCNSRGGEFYMVESDSDGGVGEFGMDESESEGHDVSKGSSTYIGKLRSNFLGTKFTVYDAQPPNGGALATKCRSFRPGSLKRVSPRVPAGNYPVSNISYELNVLGSRGPRRMQCIMNAIPTTAMEPGGVAPTQTEFQLSNMDSFSSLPFFRSKSARMDNSQSGLLSAQKDSMLMLKNKAPRWHEQLQCWCLNFNGRVTVASVKNFQLVASLENGEDENVIIQFGKVGKDAFTMDYQYPISAFQAFAICLSSFDTKIACE